MNRHILYITSEMLPGYGLPVGGGGIRAWGMGNGLESRGHTVHYSLPEELIKKITNPPETLVKYAHQQEKINELINQIKPDVVMFQQWPPAYHLEKTDIPVVIDLHGSLMIENSFRNLGDFRNNATNKLRTLQKADFFTCAGERQKYYWWAWLIMAGMDPKDIAIATVPVSLSPELPQHQYPADPIFVFGGVSWAWQDPRLALNTIANEMTTANRGQLKIYSGKHPFHSIQGEKYNDLQQQVEANPRIQFSPMISREELIKEYCSSTVAVDVMERNTERELAFTTRTIEYLWCGLPVIYGDYLELSDSIREYSAGWIVNPLDTDALKKISRQILENPDRVKEYSGNALKLVRDKFTWDKTIEPLDQFCQKLTLRDKPPHVMDIMTTKITTQEKELENVYMERGELQRQLFEVTREYKSVKHDLDAIRNKALFKAYKSIKRILKME